MGKGWLLEEKVVAQQGCASSSSAHVRSGEHGHPSREQGLVLCSLRIRCLDSFVAVRAGDSYAGIARIETLEQWGFMAKQFACIETSIMNSFCNSRSSSPPLRLRKGE